MTTPTPLPDGVRTHWVYQKAIAITGQIYTDQTGRFPVTSSRGNKYLMVVYDYDSNSITAEPMKSRSENDMVKAYTTIHTFLTSRGMRPILQRLDNECPAGLKKFMHQQGVDYQLVPPHLHRTNSAENAIATWKNHFVAGLSGTDPNFPMHLWCRLVQHANLTLNLLRASRINPRLSAHAQLHGAFDYNRTPLAPPGTKVLIYETPQERRTWAPHGVEGWYLGGAPEHYRCHRVYVTKTRAERIAKTVEFFPHNWKVPEVSPAHAATQAAQDLTEALLNPAPNVPFATVGATQRQALRQLAAIFEKLTTSKSTPPTQPRVPRNPDPHNPNTRQTTSRPQTIHTPGNNAPHASPRVPLDGPHLIAPEPEEQREETTTPTRYNLRSHSANQVEANAVIDTVTGVSLEYRHLVKGPDKDIWVRAFANDLGMLAQGVGQRQPTGTNTIFFIPAHQVPAGRQVTYGRICANIRPHKVECNRVRLTVGGDKLDYPGITTTDTASLTTTKCLLNSTVSTPGAKFLVVDVKNFYYETPMERYEYMRIPLALVPLEIVDQYNLNTIAKNGWIYLEIRKGMPGLKQAGKIANDRLKVHLAKYGYTPTALTPALWKHKTRPITFTLVVDDFGIKYEGNEHAQHLIASLKAQYKLSIDWTATSYCGLKLAWDYIGRTVDISMPGYIQAALHRFQHPTPAHKQDAPHEWTKPIYGAATQYAINESEDPRLPTTQITIIQQIVGTLLYYAIAVDPTMLVALGDLSSEQTKATAHTWNDVTWLLNYAHTHPDATIRYVASDMQLHVHSDASYLSVTRARSRAGGHFTLNNIPKPQQQTPHPPPTLNGPIHTICKIMSNVMGSAAEAEIGATYINAQESVPIRTTLVEMGHPQPPTPIQVDNTTAVGFANGTIKQKRSKAIDMRFYWLQDRTRQGQFRIYWGPGNKNLADYHTKHHSATHHREMRNTFIHPAREQLTNQLLSCLLRGCANSPYSGRRTNRLPTRGTYKEETRTNRRS
jgi:hypothetical protein